MGASSSGEDCHPLGGCHLSYKAKAHRPTSQLSRLYFISHIFYYKPEVVDWGVVAGCGMLQKQKSGSGGGSESWKCDCWRRSSVHSHACDSTCGGAVVAS